MKASSVDSWSAAIENKDKIVRWLNTISLRESWYTSNFCATQFGNNLDVARIDVVKQEVKSANQRPSDAERVSDNYSRISTSDFAINFQVINQLAQFHATVSLIIFVNCRHSAKVLANFLMLPRSDQRTRLFPRSNNIRIRLSTNLSQIKSRLITLISQ